MTLSDYIYSFCSKHKISISKLARHAGMSRSTLYAIMEDANPTVKNLCKLAVAMQVHPNFLLNLEWQKCKLEGIKATPIEPLKDVSNHVHHLLDNAHFVSETMPDGSLVSVNERFTKTWRLQNSGEVVWKERKLVCQNTYEDIQQQDCLQLFTDKRNFYIKPIQDSIDIPLTKPSETVDLTVEFIAPSVPALVFSYWKMTYTDGSICFPNCVGVYLQVQVISAGSAQCLS